MCALPFVCRMLGHITVFPFWLLPLGLHPSLFPLSISSPHAVPSLCSTYIQMYVPCSMLTLSVWGERLRDSGVSMNSRVRQRVGELWVIHSCAHITAVCVKPLHFSYTGPMIKVHLNNRNITTDGSTLPVLIKNKQHLLMATWFSKS